MEEWPTINTDSLFCSSMQNRNFNHEKSTVVFDPHQLMIKRKKQIDDPLENVDVPIYDQNDIFELEEFCRKHNIFGFNFGKLNPKAALQMLKNKMGIIENNNNIKKILHG